MQPLTLLVVLLPCALGRVPSLVQVVINAPNGGYPTHPLASNSALSFRKTGFISDPSNYEASEVCSEDSIELPEQPTDFVYVVDTLEVGSILLPQNGEIEVDLNDRGGIAKICPRSSESLLFRQHTEVDVYQLGSWKLCKEDKYCASELNSTRELPFYDFPLDLQLIPCQHTALFFPDRFQIRGDMLDGIPWKDDLIETAGALNPDLWDPTVPSVSHCNDDLRTRVCESAAETTDAQCPDPIHPMCSCSPICALSAVTLKSTAAESELHGIFRTLQNKWISESSTAINVAIVHSKNETDFKLQVVIKASSPYGVSDSGLGDFEDLLGILNDEKIDFVDERSSLIQQDNSRGIWNLMKAIGVICVCIILVVALIKLAVASGERFLGPRRMPASVSMRALVESEGSQGTVNPAFQDEEPLQLESESLDDIGIRNMAFQTESGV